MIAGAIPKICVQNYFFEVPYFKFPILFIKENGVKSQGILDFKHGRLYTINLCVFIFFLNNDTENQ